MSPRAAFGLTVGGLGGVNALGTGVVNLYF
jgi:hypothetical protein